MKTYNENISYEIVENGYKIYLDGELWITQLDEYSKPYDKSKSYEENCIMQLDNITAPAPAPDVVIPEEALREIEEVYAND